jgi:cobalt/nickel transport system permease protein
MHIPDGYLSPVAFGGFWAVMTPIWVAAARRVERRHGDARLPRLALASAFSLVLMTVAFPLPGGTSAHLSGAPLAALWLGPAAAILALSTALGVQALLFGEGGVTVLAANAFLIGVVGSLAASTVQRVLTRQDRPRPLVSAIAAYVATNVSALAAAVTLGLQPSLGAGYFPYGPRVTIPALMAAHLSVVGPLEALLTAMAVAAAARTAFPPKALV